MGDTARFPEAHRVAPLGLGADPDRGAGVDADAGRIAPHRLGHRTQLVKSGHRFGPGWVVQRLASSASTTEAFRTTRSCPVPVLAASRSRFIAVSCSTMDAT